MYGGTFDPVHVGHIEPAAAAMRLFGKAGVLVYVPAARSPHKAGGPTVSDEDRVAMLRLAVGGRAVIWTDEIDRASMLREHGGRSPASYSIDSVRRLRKVLGRQITLRLLIGSDQAAAFHTWKDSRALIRLAEPLVILREPCDSSGRLFDDLARARFWKPAEIAQWMTRIAPTSIMPGESTTMRGQMRAGADPQRALQHVPPAVRDYIKTHGLYRPHER